MMTAIEEAKRIQNILKLHSACDVLKECTRTDCSNSQRTRERYESVADQVFGACVYAVMIYSESSSKFNLGRVLIMLLLNKFLDSSVSEMFVKGENPLVELERWGELKGILEEYATCDTEDAKTAHICEDFERCYNMNVQIPKNEQYYGHVFYRQMMQLKRLIRTGWVNWNVKRDRIESVAEHTVATAILAIGMQSEFYPNEDLNELVLTAILHEAGETKIGDITPYQGVSQEEKERKEYEAIKSIFQNLKRGNQYISLLVNFMHSRSSTIHEIAYMCDKSECDLTAIEYDKNHDCFYESACDALKSNQQLRELFDEGAMTMADFFYEVDIGKYNSVFQRIVETAYCG